MPQRLLQPLVHEAFRRLATLFLLNGLVLLELWPFFLRPKVELIQNMYLYLRIVNFLTILLRLLDYLMDFNIIYVLFHQTVTINIHSFQVLPITNYYHSSLLSLNKSHLVKQVHLKL